MSSKASGLSAALYLIFCLLTRPYFAWFRHIKATFLRMFMFNGELSFLARDASSRNTTSRLQCSWLSMDQCLRTACANPSSDVSDVMKYRVSQRVSPRSHTVETTRPTPFNERQSGR